MKNKAVLLGRFSPFHKGHQAEVDLMIKKHGIENCLVIIGSSDSYNFRTPFSFEERAKIIKTIYPEIEVIPLPDIQRELAYFDGSTNDKWLGNIKEIETKRGEKFIFYGGSTEDLVVLSEQFETRIAVDRNKDPLTISATEVRKELDNKNEEGLSRMLDARVIPLVKEYYQKFLETHEEFK